VASLGMGNGFEYGQGQEGSWCEGEGGMAWFVIGWFIKGRCTRVWWLCGREPRGFRHPKLENLMRRGYAPRPIAERRTQWNDRRVRVFAWNTPRTLPGEENAASRLRDEVREWERDEQLKMEQERLGRQGARWTLDHLR
jgi:hypothetical protein